MTTLTLSVQHHCDDKVKEDAHDDVPPEMLKLPQGTWIKTLLEGPRPKHRTTHIQGTCHGSSRTGVI